MFSICLVIFPGLKHFPIFIKFYFYCNTYITNKDDFMKLFSLTRQQPISHDLQEKWLLFYYKIHLASLIVSAIIELLLSILLYLSDQIQATRSVYLAKYLFIPITCNVLLVLGSRHALHNTRLSGRVRSFLISGFMMLSCGVLYTVHSIFTSLPVIFIVPVLIASVYGDYLLTVSLSVSGLILRVYSELMITWDPTKKSLWQTDALGILDFFLSVILLACIYAAIVVITSFEYEKNAAYLEKTQEKVRLLNKIKTDPLTGLYNRLALEQQLQQICSEDIAGQWIMAMCDLDHFKKINDTLGHPTGDTCLKLIGSIMRQADPHVTAFRYGGDEFCLLFSDTDLDSAVSVCQQIQDRLLTDKPQDIPLTLSLSFGLARGSHNISPKDFLELADQALYSAKQNRGSIHVMTCIKEKGTGKT